MNRPLTNGAAICYVTSVLIIICIIIYSLISTFRAMEYEFDARQKIVEHILDENPELRDNIKLISRVNE